MNLTKLRQLQELLRELDHSNIMMTGREAYALQDVMVVVASNVAIEEYKAIQDGEAVVSI